MADLAEPFRTARIDCVACIDALGFILGAAVAGILGAGVVPIRKGGKLPVATEGVDFRDYSGEVKRLEIRPGIVRPGARILLIDEWIETGAQIGAAAELIEGQGGAIIAVATIRMDSNQRIEEIRKRYPVHTLWEEEDGAEDR